MLDIKSKLVLKIIIKECPNGQYSIIENSDIISALPNKYKLDSEGLQNTMNYLEHLDCVSIKYEEDGVYCVCVLPFGYELIENDNQRNEQCKSPNNYWLFIIVFALTILGSILGNIISKFINF